MNKLTKAQRRIITFIRDWEVRNEGAGVPVGRGMEGTNQNDEPVAYRLEKRGYLECTPLDFGQGPNFNTTDSGIAAIS